MMNCILGFYVIIPQEEYALFFSQLFNLKWFHNSLFMIWINLFSLLMDADLMYILLPV